MTFVINSNNLTSTIPAWPLPATLTALDVSNNQLTGQLPSDWKLSAVRAALTLSVSNNSLSGTGCRVRAICCRQWPLLVEPRLSSVPALICPAGPLPAYPDTDAVILVQPGNPGLCGEVGGGMAALLSETQPAPAGGVHLWCRCCRLAC